MSDDRTLDVLYVSPERFRASPQVGVGCRMSWTELAGYLSRPSIGEAKGDAGAWSPALYTENVRRKANLVSIGALVVDVDEGGHVDTVVEVVARYDAIVHETFSSTDDAPRCRVVLLLAEAIDAASYEAAHRVVRGHLARAGVVADEAAKDASRVSYSPVRRAGAGYRFRLNIGRPLDAVRLLAAQPPPPPRPAPTYTASEHADRYVQGALRRAAEAVAHAGEGTRNATLNREAYALARLDVDAGTIATTLGEAARSAGLAKWEIDRTLVSALRARRGAA